jgi:DNA-directed RNA polymerase specialized sigma24 family protein
MIKGKNTVFDELRQLSLFLTPSKVRLKKGMQLKPSKELTNDEILPGIKEGDQAVFLYVKRLVFPAVTSFIKQNGGNGFQSEEVFQDALIVIFKKLLKGPVELQCKFSTYFLSVCKIIWRFNHKNNYSRAVNLVDLVEDTGEIEEIYKGSKEFKLYRKHFNKLKVKKQSILMASLSGKSYQELYEKFGYKSADVFKTEVSRIKKQLVESITSDPEYNCFDGKNNWSI